MEEVSVSPTAPPTPSRDIEASRLVAALSWIWVLSIIILLVKKDSEFVRFHARQSFVILLLSVVLFIFFGFLGALGWVLQWFLQLTVFVVSVVGFIQALRGKWWTLPGIGPLAAKVRL